MLMARVPDAHVRRWTPSAAFLALLPLFLLLTVRPAFGSEVEARLSTTAVSLTETLELVLETTERPSSAPDLSALSRDFRILGQRTRSQESVINGRRQGRYLLILRLRPKRTGLLEIPPIVLGDASSQSLRLLVNQVPAKGVEPATQAAPPHLESSRVRVPVSAADMDGRVRIEVSVEPQEVYVRQQALLIARVRMASPVMGPHLLGPQVRGARLLPLGEDSFRERIDGADYGIYERRYAIFPAQAGSLEIGPLTFEGWAHGGASSASPRDRQPVRAVSEALSLRVRPLPVDAAPDAWLPARGLTLTESGPATYRIKTEQPLVRVIEVTGEGVLAADLPAVAVQPPPGLEALQRGQRLWDERLPGGVVGHRRESIRLIAGDPGHYRLPPIEIDWWDTRAQGWRKARLAARELIVIRDILPDEGGSSRARGGLDTEAESPGIHLGGPPSPAEVPLQAPESTQFEPNPWLWAMVALTLAGLGTMMVWWRARRGTQQEASPQAPPVPARGPRPGAPDPVEEAIAAVRDAYEQADAAVAREALLEWGRQVLADAPPSNLARLAQRCQEPLRGEILTLEQAFFSLRPPRWERLPVWERLRHFEPAPKPEPASFRRAKPLRRHRPDRESP